MALLETSTTVLLQGDLPLTTTEAHELLCADDEGVSRLPFWPMIFQYYNREGPQDWWADGHRWINQGTTSLPRRNPLIKKNYFYIQTEAGGASKRFMRNIYFLPNNKDTGPFIIQYLGDSSTGHCNSKKDTVNVYVQTKMNTWSALVENEDAYVIYKKEVACENENTEKPVEEELLGRPRNVEQLRNLKKKVNREQRLKWDKLYNVHEMAHDMDNFVHFINTFPDLVIICGLKQILEEMELVLGDLSLDQLLSYDTTFTMGDFYV